MPTKPVPASEDEIRALAHKLWEDDGRPEGQSESHWQRACMALAKPEEKPEMKETSAPAVKKTSKKKPA
jgi:hypothetical protein